MLSFGEGGDGGDLGIEGSKVLLDHICQLGNLDGSIVKEGFPASHWQR